MYNWYRMAQTNVIHCPQYAVFIIFQLISNVQSIALGIIQ